MSIPKKVSIRNIFSSSPGEHPPNLDLGQVAYNVSESGSYIYIGTGNDLRVDYSGSDLSSVVSGAQPRKGWVRLEIQKVPSWGDISGSILEQEDIQLFLGEMNDSISEKMVTADYDSNSNGVVDKASSIDGVATAGNARYYGTDVAGAGGFHSLPTPTAGEESGLGDMLKSVYDTNNNGVVDVAATVQKVTTYGSVYVAAPAVAVIPLFTAPVATLINGLRGIKVSEGAATISIQIGGVAVTGLGALNITATPQDFTATALNSVSVGGRVTVEVTSMTDAVGLEFTLSAEVG